MSAQTPTSQTPTSQTPTSQGPRSQKPSSQELASHGPAAPTPVVTAVSRNGVYSFTKPVREEITLIAGLGVEGDVHAGVNVRHRSRVGVDPAQPNLRQVHLIQGELFDEVRRQGYAVAPGNLGENVTTNGIDLLGLPRGTILRFGPPLAGDGDAASQQPGSRAGRASEARAASEVGPASPPLASEAGRATQVRPVTAVASVTSARPATDAVAGVMAAAETATLNDPTANAVVAMVAAARRDSSDAGSGDRRTAVVITGLRNPCAQINGFQPGLLKEVIGQDGAGNVVRRAGVMGVVLRGGRIRPGDPVTVELPPLPHLPLECI
jgi:MOSC domain-containing protein YiiM